MARVALSTKMTPKSVGPAVTYTRDDLVGVFNRHDKNKDGRLSISELKEAFEQIGSRWPPMRAFLELLHADENHNGFIDKEEFEKFIDHVLKNLKKRTVGEILMFSL
ncbi:Calcium-binding protein CML24 [Morella rubra]|uniref:Calcium-binding protein CML24 n=1 Tax=Morella rubra TaxID=262757 RepID=A0A6A1UHP2_9ROSI|nr:Calcium-binding protein CML24 [Morella rubra]